jgi:hypothetical protein
MRVLKIAAIVGVGMTIAGVAFAGPWNDPAGRVNFTAPSGWVTQAQRSPANQTTVLTGNANDECYVFTSLNTGTANAPANRVHALTDPMSASDWATLANVVTPMFPHHNASASGMTVETTGFWPIQRAQLGGAERPVLAALTRRPGVDLVAMCWTYGGPDATGTYESVFRSLSNANDAALQATAAQQEAAHAAAQQAAVAQPAQAQPTQQTRAQQEAARGRNGHARGEGPALNPGPH